jgi:hypothetical protein
VNKIKTWLPLVLVIGGFLLIYAGWELLSLPILVQLGMLPIGLGVILFGVDAIQKRGSSYMVGGEDVERSETYYGFAAIMDGIVLSMLGLVITVYAGIALLGQGDNALAFIRNHPSPALLFGGALAAAYSFTLILGTHESRRLPWSFLSSLPGRVLGIVLLFLSLGALFLGGLEIISPNGFDQLIATLKASLPTLPK